MTLGCAAGLGIARWAGDDPTLTLQTADTHGSEVFPSDVVPHTPPPSQPAELATSSDVLESPAPTEAGPSASSDDTDDAADDEARPDGTGKPEPPGQARRSERTPDPGELPGGDLPSDAPETPLDPPGIPSPTATPTPSETPTPTDPPDAGLNLPLLPGLELGLPLGLLF